ncbi:MAG: hypothetical protein D6714_10760 [Bacteroidetes bacterium]|nr:MAG: hypothetical protein D6714_10760 [Bacteroidota bacterium]
MFSLVVQTWNNIPAFVLKVVHRGGHLVKIGHSRNALCLLIKFATNLNSMNCKGRFTGTFCFRKERPRPVKCCLTRYFFGHFSDFLRVAKKGIFRYPPHFSWLFF